MSKRWYGSLQNRLAEMYTADTFKVGQPMTESMYSDRHVYYIKSIDKFDGKGRVKELTLIRPKVACKDYFAGNWEVQSFEDALADKPMVRPADDSLMDYPNQTLKIFRTRRGTYTMSGSVYGTVFVPGNLGEYEDPSF